MTDPELTAAQERAVRDLLASARHDGPVPPEVAARLDATLADLVGARGAGAAPTTSPTTTSPTDRPPPPVSLAARRRRRLATAVLAAAAVVVGAIGVSGVISGGIGGSGSGDDASTTADLGSDSAGGDAEGAPQSQALRPRRSAAQSDAGVERQYRGGRVVLSDESFRDGVSALAAVPTADAAARQAPTCGIAELGRGRRVSVVYAGDDGVLVYRPARDDRQRVDLYLCGSDAIARSVFLRQR